MTLVVHTDSLPNLSLGEVLARQLDALDAFAAHRRAALASPEPASREQRMDVQRQHAALAARQAALVARLDALWQASDHPMQCVRPTALIAHRHPWFAQRLARLLAERGMTVLGTTASGPEAVGWAVADVPDVVVVGDTLETLPGETVVRELRRYCPTTLVVAQVATADQVGTMLHAGAGSVHSPAVPPADVAEAVLAGLAELLTAGVRAGSDRRIPGAT